MITNELVVKRWKEEICNKAKEIDPRNEYIWGGIWVGFVIGLGRPDLANDNDYMELGYPEERAL